MDSSVGRAGEAAARQALSSLMQLEREIVELRYTQRLDATDRVREALRRLGEARPRPLEILERAAAELGGATGLDAVLVSRVSDGAQHAVAVWRSGTETAFAADDLAAIAIARGSSEAWAVEHRAALLADGPPAAVARGALGDGAFVVGPIAPRGDVVALVHGAVAPGRRPLGELDRELVELFGAGLGGVLERVALEQALARHRGELAAAARFLARGAGASPGPPAGAPRAAGDAADPLTARELEVLDLLAEGRTNRAIAERLRISEGTVKYHVKNILRKLRARSRADAVARHLQAPAWPPRPAR